jgi:hypothetical protein
MIKAGQLWSAFFLMEKVINYFFILDLFTKPNQKKQL